MDKSLGDGLIGVEETLLYRVSNNSQTRTSMMTFTNVSGGSVVLNIYKKVNGINCSLSPKDLILLEGSMCQEDGPITLGTNDSIVGTCSVEGGVSFVINGEEVLR